MKNYLTFVTLISVLSAFGQVTSTLDNIKTVAISGYYYDKADEFEKTLDKDTLILPASLPFKKGCKIFYDKDRKKLATEIVFDSIHYRIITKHYNRTGKLIKEQKGWISSYKKDYNYDPLKPVVGRLEYLKTYQNDSLIYEITGMDGGNLLIEYFNPFTKHEFKKRVYYDAGYINSEVVWNYYENRKLKSICNIYWELKFIQGDEIVETMFDCINFDQNGCIISK
jgi:hypothetical protein